MTIAQQMELFLRSIYSQHLYNSRARPFLENFKDIELSLGDGSRDAQLHVRRIIRKMLQLAK